jgi:DNA-binding SARP family transcriptional activator
LRDGTEITLCGRLRAQVAGEPREELLHGRQGRLLFAFLVLNRQRPTTRDALVEAIWGESGLPPSEGALAPLLSRLRRALAPAKVEGRDPIALSLPQPAWVDVEAAHTALSRARAADQPADRLAAALQASNLVEPGLLPGLDAPWLAEARDAVERVRIEALELGADAARTVDPPLAESLARAAITAAPFRESAWICLIATLQARGNMAQALQAYEEVRRLLRDELGAVPGPELLALHGRLLAQGDEVTSRPGRPATEAPAAPRQAKFTPPAIWWSASRSCEPWTPPLIAWLQVRGA